MHTLLFFAIMEANTMEGGHNLEKIQIKNVRSLGDTGVVPLSPITLLIGENSSGKSTFLRTFPLIKQSISKRTDGPLLWAGDADDYVDFGSFSETVTNDGSNGIVFDFEFQARCIGASRSYGYSLRNDALRRELKKDDVVSYSITIEQKDGHEYISKLFVKLNQTLFEFTLEPRPFRGKAVVDGIPVFEPSKTRKLAVYSELGPVYIERSIFGFVLPSIMEMTRELFEFFEKEPLMETADTEENDEYIRHRYYSRIANVLQYIGALLCKGMPLEEILHLDSKTESPQLLSVIEKLSTMPQEEQTSMIRQLKLIAFYDTFPQIDKYLDTYFHQVHYIAPLRATAERYYRLRNLAIDEVDYQGKNLPIFLSGLSQERLNSFQNWTQKYFGFKVFVDKNGGHLSVKLALQAGDGINLSDTGFGYSQILPIITQIWDLSTAVKIGRRGSVPLVIAIEQPELHLHPALQAKLAEAFIASIRLAKEYGYQLQLLLETHSETIVNYFGRAIARGTLRKEDISIILFNKDATTSLSTVKTTTYNKDGYLLNWPIGFFAPER